MISNDHSGKLRMRTGERVKSLKPIDTSSSNRESGVGDGSVLRGEPLSPGSRVFLEPVMNCCILVVMGTKTALDVEIIKEGLKDTLVKHPRFSSKLVVDTSKKGGNKTWVRTQVNMDDHVIVPDLNPDMDAPDKFIEHYVSDLTAIPIDFTKPLWELHLLNIKTSDANGIAVLKMHHSLGDGISLTSLLLACARKTSDPNSLPTLPNSITNKKKKKKTTQKPMWRLLVDQVMYVLRLLWYTTVHMLQFLATMLVFKDTSNTPISAPPGTEHNPRRVVHRTVGLDDIKLVKNEMNATVNDVMMGLIQAGLSRYLNRRYGDIANQIQGSEQKQDNIPKNLRIRACLLVNVRPSSGIQELADMMEKGSNYQWGNKIGYIILPFHIALRDDPLDYIRQAKATIDQKKHSLESRLTYASALIILKLFGEKVVATLSHRVVKHTTMSFSNVIGPAEDISFYGHPIAFFAPTAYGHPQALTIHFQSHGDKMTIVVSVDESVVSDPLRLCDDLEESLHQIKNALPAHKS